MDCRQAGMKACVKKQQKIHVKTCNSWSALALSTFSETPSGSDAFQMKAEGEQETLPYTKAYLRHGSLFPKPVIDITLSVKLDLRNKCL